MDLNPEIKLNKVNPIRTKRKDDAISLNTGQNEILEHALEYLNGDSNEPFIISGAAGTGKTTLAGKIIEQSKLGTLICAPTHKATRVLSSKLSYKKAMTLHAALGFKLNTNLENFDPNNPAFSQINRVKLIDYPRSFIDESSMINRKLNQYLKEYATEHNLKLIFIGDKYQLAPVGEQSSVVFETEDNIHNLTEIIRQVLDNPLSEILKVLREDVELRSSNLLRILYGSNIPGKVKDDKGFSLYSSKSSEAKTLFQDTLIATFTASSDVSKVKYLAFTNDNVSAWNNYIRNTINANDDIIANGDLIMGYNTIVDKNNNPIIINSEEYRVETIERHVNSYGFKVFMVQLREIFSNKVTPYMYVLDSDDEDTVIAFTDTILSLLNNVYSKFGRERSKAWGDYYYFKDSHVLMRDIIKPGTNKTLVSKDIDYAYALTVHKSQGSTYDNVFVNARNIIYDYKGRPYRDINQRNRLLYVSFSRPRKKADILT